MLKGWRAESRALLLTRTTLRDAYSIRHARNHPIRSPAQSERSDAEERRGDLARDRRASLKRNTAPSATQGCYKIKASESELFDKSGYVARLATMTNLRYRTIPIH